MNYIHVLLNFHIQASTRQLYEYLAKDQRKREHILTMIAIQRSLERCFCWEFVNNGNKAAMQHAYRKLLPLLQFLLILTRFSKSSNSQMSSTPSVK